MPHVFYDSAEVYIVVLAVIINMHDGNKSNLRTTEARMAQKRKNNESRQKFTGSDKNACIGR